MHACVRDCRVAVKKVERVGKPGLLSGGADHPLLPLALPLPGAAKVHAHIRTCMQALIAAASAQGEDGSAG